MKPFLLSTPSQMHPQFLIAQRGDTWIVEAFMMLGQPWPAAGPWITETGQYIIGGQAAELLFVCLAGHTFGKPSSLATLDVARQARAHLAAIALSPGGYWLANRVVLHWDQDTIWPEMIRPSLGLCCRCQRRPTDGHRLLCTSCYAEGGRPIGK